ncbi:MAG: hypothetical protein LBC08_01165 [Campylobacteraceae bacterium]|jgi:hypothetical protein|nr:hypothetical protein [Campylobacteraceae bacterium]
MSSRKKRLLPKNQQLNIDTPSKEPKNAAQYKHTKELSAGISQTWIALFCIAVMLCSAGTVAYIVFIDPLL